MKMKCKTILASILSLSLLVSSAAFTASADPAAEIKVKIGDGEPVAVATFADAMAQVRAADDATAKVITLGEGGIAAADANTFRIDENNVTIEGAGADKTTINTVDFAVSGQAGVLVAADNVVIKNLKVVSNNPGVSGGVIKVSKIGDATELPLVKNVSIENVVLTAESAGFGLNLHGVEGANIKNVTVTKAVKASVNVAKATAVVFDTLKTGESGWETDVVFSYNEKNPAAYGTASEASFKNCTFANNMIRSERPAEAAGGTDQITCDNEGMTVVTGPDGSWAVVSEDDPIAVTAITNVETGKKYATIQSAIDAAQDGQTIAVPAGEYQENLTVTKDLTIQGAGEDKTVIKFDKSTRQGVEYFGGRIAYPTVYATADLTLENLTIAGPTDEHHGIDGILAKADLTMKKVTVTDMRCTADGAEMCGVQYGRPVMVDGQGKVIIEDCTFVKFQKQAIDLNTKGEISIKNVVIKGAGENSIIAQNGIVLRAGTAVIDNVKISGLKYKAGNEYDGCSVAIYTMENVKATVTNATIEDVDGEYYAEGDSKITVTEGNKVYEVTAEGEKLVETLPTGVTLDKTEATLKVGDSLTLKATVVPDDTTDKTVVWSSSDPSVAKVDENGKVTAVAAGKATITATVGGVSATCEVEVTPVSPETGMDGATTLLVVLASAAALALIASVAAKKVGLLSK